MSDFKTFVEFVSEPGDLMALVMPNGILRGRSAGRTAVGFYKDRAKLFEEAKILNGSGNLYVNLNQLNPDVYGRAAERIKPYSPTRFTDAEILRRRAILLDFDSVRVTGVNATDDELQSEIDLAETVSTYLRELWRVEPLMLISGNGVQLLFRIDEPANSPLVSQALLHLHNKYSTDKVKIDTSVSDAARITRLPGTLNMKGDDLLDRPRRIARIVSVPGERRIVSTEQLSMLSVEMTNTKSMSGTLRASALGAFPASRGDWTHERLRDLLDNKYDREYREIKDENKNYDENIAYELKTCPFNEHGDEEWKTRIGLINGRPGIKCFHDSCSNPKKTFYDFLSLYAPEPPLAITDELRLARHVASVFSRNGAPTLRYYEGDWYFWEGFWNKLSDEDFIGQLYSTCKTHILEEWPAYSVITNRKTVPTLGKPLIGNVTLALKSILTVKNAGWSDGRGARWIAFRDRLLNLDSWIAGEIVSESQTPEYFSPTALSYPLTYTEDEPTVFLDKLKEQVTESEVAALQEFGGYCLTDETAIQRILYLVGPPRSFKGTYERVVRATIGEHNAVSKTFASFLNPHGLENVPGKTFLGISDSRPDPKLSRQAVERLISISGEDSQDINPKGRAVRTVKLVCKIGIASNIMADFADPTGALQSRFLFVETTKSFAAKPDPTLLDRILTQQNELTWWFLRGLRRLLQNGNYTEPKNKNFVTAFKRRVIRCPHLLTLSAPLPGGRLTN